jgi:hypothetical protein
MDSEQLLAFWSKAYIALLSAGRAPSAAREYADEAVRDFIAREKTGFPEE